MGNNGLRETWRFYKHKGIRHQDKLRFANSEISMGTLNLPLTTPLGTVDHVKLQALRSCIGVAISNKQ